MGKHIQASIRIANNDSIKEPGYLFYMDKAESTNPGRPLIHSGRDSKKKMHVVTIFIESIPKKVFIGFQRSI